MWFSYHLLFSLLFLFIVALQRFSVLTPIMNSISAFTRENSEKRTSPYYSCLYCKRAFSSYQALGGHLKTHSSEIKSRWRRQPPGRSGVFIALPSANTNLLSRCQSKNSSGGSGDNHSRSDKVFSVHATFAPSGSTAATGVPLDPSSCLGMPGVSQVHTGGARTFRDGQNFFGDALQNFEHNLSKPSSSASTVANPRSCLDLNQSTGVNETSVASSFFMDPYQCLGRDEGCHNKMKEVKRQHSLDSLGITDLIKASKRPKIISNLPVETEKFQNKEPRLFKDVEKPFTGLGISVDPEQEVLAELDLSLHL